MCGICGYYSTKEIDPTVLKKMNDRIIHRGPDDDGFYRDRHVALAARRLSIIDLSTGHQPLSSDSGNCWIAYNGEVYNFSQLRSELETKGIQFKTKTDTEVIVNLYEQIGPSFADHLRGMFAVAIHDRRSDSLILTRDPVGIKPLYYLFQPEKNLLVFGSEIKSILEFPGVSRELDPEALDYFLSLEYIPAPLSIFRSIRKLPPGHTLHYSPATGLTITPYWTLTPGIQPESTSLDDLLDTLRSLLSEAVGLRLISDVPLGAFLSGGIDSSTVVAMMARQMDRPVKTFSIGFSEGTYNELGYADRVAKALKTDHRTRLLSPDILELCPFLSDFLDEPLGDFSNFPTYLVSKMAREEVTVSLSGDGGDEVFGGYDHYLAQNLSTRFYGPIGRLLPALDRLLSPREEKQGLVNRVKRFSEGFNYAAGDRHFRWMQFMTADQKRSLYSDTLMRSDFLTPLHTRQPFADHFRASEQFDGINRDLFLDLKTYLPDNILVKVDRMSMATSLEARVPLLDKKLVEFAFSLPSRLKIKGRSGKWILKEAMRGILPEEILQRGKKGFSIPIKNWLRTDLQPLVQKHLTPSAIGRFGYFRPETVGIWVDEHMRGRRDHAHRLWALIQFSLWAERFL
jgi:asparagine synthase (glutamine-hydrolysing)